MAGQEMPDSALRQVTGPQEQEAREARVLAVARYAREMRADAADAEDTWSDLSLRGQQSRIDDAAAELRIAHALAAPSPARQVDEGDGSGGPARAGEPAEAGPSWQALDDLSRRLAALHFPSAMGVPEAFTRVRYCYHCRDAYGASIPWPCPTARVAALSPAPEPAPETERGEAR